MSRIITTCGFLFLLGMLLTLAALLHFLSSTLPGRNLQIWLTACGVGLIGLILILSATRTLRSACGRTLFKHVFHVKAPGRSVVELVAPSDFRAGKIVLLLEGSPDRFRGNISLKRPQPNPLIQSNSIVLSPIKPSFRIRFPSWLRWFNVSDADKVQEFWPKGTGQSSYALEIPFKASISKGESIALEFDWHSNFEGTNLESVYPLSGSEKVTVCIRS